MAGCRIEARDTKTFGVGERERVLSQRDFFPRNRRALGFLREPRCLAMVARNSVMVGVPNACGRFRDSGNPVIG
jgi:hypothetical protein